VEVGNPVVGYLQIGTTETVLGWEVWLHRPERRTLIAVCENTLDRDELLGRLMADLTVELFHAPGRVGSPPKPVHQEEATVRIIPG
jgi:hypothetical protein